MQKVDEWNQFVERQSALIDDSSLEGKLIKLLLESEKLPLILDG